MPLPDLLLAALSRPDLPLLAAAVLAAGVVRGFSGFGTALIFMPVAVMSLPGATAIAALLVFDAFGGLYMLPRAARACDRGAVARLSLGFVLAVPLGAAALAAMDPQALRWVIAAMALGTAALLGSGARLPPGLPAWAATPVGGACGIFAGVSGLGGVPAVLWQLARDEAPERMRATLITFFMVGTAGTAATLFASGLAGLDAVALGLLLGPVFLLGTLTGQRLFPLAPPILFRRLAFVLIVGAAVSGLPLWD